MSALSDKTLRYLCRTTEMVTRRGGVGVAIQPVSIDLHLAEVELPNTDGDGKQFIGETMLWTGQFTLGCTEEAFRMPENVVGHVVGKSTLAREGLQVECAGLVDPGFRGELVLELKNLHHTRGFRLRVGMPIAQVWFEWTDQPVGMLYGTPEAGSHYQGQKGITPSYRYPSL